MNGKSKLGGQHPRSKNSRQDGFSLIEILIVLALIALLAGVVVTNFTGIFAGGQESTAKIFVDAAVDAPPSQIPYRHG